MTESLAEPPGNLESISRHEIGAPAGYVSVYHETTADRLPSIERIGIRSGFKERNIGSFGTTDTVNQLFDQDRPERLATLGVSRRTNTFAYYSLAFGFSLGSAAQRYVRYSKNELHQQYAVMKENDPEVLAALGVKTSKEYECKVQDPGYLRERYPGEVLELTVDPVRSYVGDLALFTEVAYEVQVNGSTNKPGAAKGYWESIITLADFRKWYSKPSGDSHRFSPYRKSVAAPLTLPGKIASPEVLIPGDVPPNHIRLLP